MYRCPLSWNCLFTINRILRTIGIVVWARILAFIKKAGSVIFVFSIILWIMSNVPGGNIEQSMLARIGRILEPVGAPDRT